MKGRTTFTKAEAEQIVDLIKQKLMADSTRQKRIRNKIRALGFYASDFGLHGGYTERDFYNSVTVTGGTNAIPKNDVASVGGRKRPSTNAKRNDSDENFIIDLCDEVLQSMAIRQAKFDFLRGDVGTKLPCDAYYPHLKLVIEYREKQHTEAVKFFDRRQTVSGVGRGEQRRIYDQRRRDMLPKHGITLVEIGYDEFEHDRSKRLIRNKEKDMAIIKKRLKQFL